MIIAFDLLAFFVGILIGLFLITIGTIIIFHRVRLAAGDTVYSNFVRKSSRKKNIDPDIFSEYSFGKKVYLYIGLFFVFLGFCLIFLIIDRMLI